MLAGCEVDQQSTNVVSERPFGTIFDAPEGFNVQPVQPIEQKENKTSNLPTSFSPKADEADTIKVAVKPGVSLDKTDILYGFYNSGIVGEAPDFENFFDEPESKGPVTKFASTESNKSTQLDTFFNSSVNPGDEFTSLDSFLGIDNQSSVDFDNLFSPNYNDSNFDFQLDQEKQKKINKIKQDTITIQKNNVIADQIRNKDIDEQLVLDLANLNKKLPINEKNLAKEMGNELRHKVRLLDAETALKIAELKMVASTRSNNIISRVEDRVLDATSAARKVSIKKILSVEPENYYQLKYQLKQQEKQLEATYQVDVATITLQFQKKLEHLDSDVKLLREANKKIIDNRAAELEAQRIADALIIEISEKEKNQKIVKQAYPALDDKILKYSNTFKDRLVHRENSLLDRLHAQYASAKNARKSDRELENRQYLSKINKQIKQEQTSYIEKSSDRLNIEKDSKIKSIAKNLNNSVNRIESQGVKALADLKAQNVREHQKLKSKLAVPYKKKEQALNQKYQQDKSKILSRFRSEEYAVVAKIKKERGGINREIDARVKSEIQTLLASFEALKKEETEKAKKINAEKPEESPGFFGSLF